MNEFIEKDIDELIRNDNRTPKILKQIILLVALFLFSIMMISAIIMGLYVRDSDNTKNNINSQTYTLDKMIISS